jgi:hypothetical protein
MMPKTRTFELPEFDDYNIRTETNPTTGTVAIQEYFLKGALVAQAEISFHVIEGEPLKWPYKFVIKDPKDLIKFTET